MFHGALPAGLGGGKIRFRSKGVEIADHHLARAFLTSAGDLAAGLRRRHDDFLVMRLATTMRGQSIP